MTDCLSVDEFASEVNDCLSVDEFASEANDCLSRFYGSLDISCAVTSSYVTDLSLESRSRQDLDTCRADIADLGT